MKHAAALLLLAALPAAAGLPLVSDTADAIAPGDCELEAAVARARARGLPSTRVGDAFFACGLPVQTEAGLGYSRASSDGLKLHAVRAAGKTTLVMPEGSRTGWGLAYGVASEKLPGTTWRLANLGLMAVATRELAPGLLGHANLGWSHSRPEHQNSTVWSLGVETTSTLVWAADVFGDDRNRPSLSTGFGYSLGGGFSANVSYALLLEAPRSKQLTLGAKLAF